MMNADATLWLHELWITVQQEPAAFLPTFLETFQTLRLQVQWTLPWVEEVQHFLATFSGPLVLRCRKQLLRMERALWRRQGNALDRAARRVAQHLRPITLRRVDREFAQLQHLAATDPALESVKPRSHLGNKVVDYFTFAERLKTRGKYKMHFLDFLVKQEWFHQKPFIRRMWDHHAKKRSPHKSSVQVAYDVFCICLTAINIMKPVTCMRLFHQFGSRRVLNCCCGWGGSLVAAAAMGLEAYYGIDLNRSLDDPYRLLILYLQQMQGVHTHMDCRIGVDACRFDYADAGWRFDTVFCSPPYFQLEQYEHSATYASRKHMRDEFYTPLFRRSYAALDPGGWFLINVCQPVYEQVLLPMLGPAHQCVPLVKAQRQNAYQEWVYAWRKPSGELHQ